MVAISKQCLFGVDRAVQISWVVFFDKGTQPELLRKKAKSPYKSGYQIFFMPSSFGFKLSENCNIVLRSMHTQQEKSVLKFLSLK